MSHGREKWKSGGRSAQTSEDSDPDWMYHQPAPDPWEQTLNKWEKKSKTSLEYRDDERKS